MNWMSVHHFGGSKRDNNLSHFLMLLRDVIIRIFAEELETNTKDVVLCSTVAYWGRRPPCVKCSDKAWSATSQRSFCLCRTDCSANVKVLIETNSSNFNRPRILEPVDKTVELLCANIIFPDEGPPPQFGLLQYCNPTCRTTCHPIDFRTYATCCSNFEDFFCRSNLLRFGSGDSRWAKSKCWSQRIFSQLKAE